MKEELRFSIPKERQAHDVFMNVSKESKLEMARVLFETLAEQEEQRESRLM